MADLCDGDCVRCADVVAGERVEHDWTQADGVFIKVIEVAAVGTPLPQHKHKHDHTTILGKGAVRFWSDDVLIGDFHAPHLLFIKAGVMHMFLTLEAGTTLFCVHNTARTGGVEIVPFAAVAS